MPHSPEFTPSAHHKILCVYRASLPMPLMVCASDQNSSSTTDISRRSSG